MQGVPGEASEFESRAAAITQTLKTHGWNTQDRHFYNALQPSGGGLGTGDRFVLYFRAATSPEQLKMALEELKKQTREPASNIEEQSYRPEVLLQFGASEEAYMQILDLSRPERERRDYPEVSYAIIGSIVTGIMGVNVVPAGDGHGDQTLAGSFALETLPRLSKHTSGAELHNLPIRHNVIDVRHQRDQSSTMRNVSGPEFTWRASFDGLMPYLVVNGKKVNASKRTTTLGTPISYVDLVVPPGQTVTVAR